MPLNCTLHHFSFYRATLC